MGTLKQKLDYINETKRLIGEAITGKGGSVTDNFREYATAITNLPSGGSESPSSVDYGKIGYTPTTSYRKSEMDKVNYSSKLYNAWNPQTTDASSLYAQDKNLILAPLIDTSNVTNMSGMFQGCSNLNYIPNFNTIKVTNMSHMFYECTGLTSFPELNTSNVTDMSYMYLKCHNLTSAPMLDTSKVTNMDYMFNNCYQLSNVPLYNTSNVISMKNMFLNTYLSSVPQFDTSKVEDMTYMFAYCQNLKEFPKLNTHNVKSMLGMYYDSQLLLKYDSKKENPNLIEIDATNATDLRGMFMKGHASLWDDESQTQIPIQFKIISSNKLDHIGQMFTGFGYDFHWPIFTDTSGVTRMNHVFQGCQGLAVFEFMDVSEMDFSNVTDMRVTFALNGATSSLGFRGKLNTQNVQSFEGCQLPGIRIDEISVKSAINTNNMFGGGQFQTQYVLIKDIGTPESVTEYNFSNLFYWGNESIRQFEGVDVTGASQTVVDSLLTYSFDRKTAGYPVCNIILSRDTFKCLTPDQTKAIQDKGYTLTVQ